MLKISINEQEICLGAGWQKPKKFKVEDIALRIKLPIQIAKTPREQNMRLEEQKFLRR